MSAKRLISLLVLLLTVSFAAAGQENPTRDSAQRRLFPSQKENRRAHGKQDPKAIIDSLNRVIESLQNELSLKSNQAEIGKTYTILVEGPSKKNPDELCGRTGSNKMCVFPDKTHKAGDYVDVTVLSCTSATLICKLA